MGGSTGQGRAEGTHGGGGGEGVWGAARPLAAGVVGVRFHSAALWHEVHAAAPVVMETHTL